VTYVVSIVLACFPTLLWKFTLSIHNDFFGAVEPTRLLDSVYEFPALAIAAARIMLDDGRLILFLLAFPCALLFQLQLRSSFPSFLVPVSITALLIGWIAVFLFSNSYALTYLETSYSRLIMIPTFSAILYCVDILIDRRTSAADESA
jgi:hypothetical protein